MTDTGFFDDNELLSRRPLPVFPECGRCGLHKTCNSPKMPVAGEGRRKILVVGEAPGQDEDREGAPFVGKAGRRLRDEVRAAGLNLFGDCWVVNAASCRPPKNQLPPNAVNHCRPLVMNAVEGLKPRAILLLGQHAIRSVLAPLWKEDPGGPGQWSGFRIPCVKWNCWVCPTYHPSHVMRNESDRRSPVASMAFARDVRKALSYRERPWAEPPDHESRLRLFTDTDDAAAWLDAMAAGRKRIAFDFETTTLKPDGPDADIVCCSVSDGRESGAFPVTGKVKEVLKLVLKDRGVKKVGANCKFEWRWAKAKLGVCVRGFDWDVILTQHAIDGRPGVSSVKFQTLARLGVQDYSESVKPFLGDKSLPGNAPNKVRRVNLRDLLRYCAYDSLFEYMIYLQQKRELAH